MERSHARFPCVRSTIRRGGHGDEAAPWPPVLTGATEIRRTQLDWLCPALFEMDISSDRFPGVAEHARYSGCHPQPFYAVQVNVVSKIVQSGQTPCWIDNNLSPFDAPGMFLRHPIVSVPL